MATPKMSNTPPKPPAASAGQWDYQDSFMAKVQRFMVTNKDEFNILTKEDLPAGPRPHLESKYLHGNPVPLECAMEVSIVECQRRLLQLLSPGDIVRGHVILKTPLALGVKLTSLVGGHKMRDLSRLDIRGLVQHENLASEKSKCDGVLQEMQLDDVLQAVVIGKEDSHVNISLSSKHVSQLCPSAGHLPEAVHIGYLEGERPDSIRPRISPRSFLSALEGSPGFTNPASSENLKAVLGIDSDARSTLMQPILTADYPTSDYFGSLRKAQRHKWSMDTVAVGVKHFKKGELDRAKKLFHHALDIDPNNVEGLVARGALYANSSRYSEAILDFEKALTINHTHRNARKYLVETQVAYGNELDKQGKFERAVVCYQEALADDPSQELARTRMLLLKKVLNKKAAEKLEVERREAAEKARLKKLHSIIEEEKEKKKKKKKKKKKYSSERPRKKKKARVKKLSKHRRHSSEEDSTTSESDHSTLYSASRSRNSSPTRTGNRKYHSRSRDSSPTRTGNRKYRSRSHDSTPTNRKYRSRSRDSSPTRSRTGNRKYRSPPSSEKEPVKYTRSRLQSGSSHSRSPLTPAAYKRSRSGSHRLRARGEQRSRSPLTPRGGRKSRSSLTPRGRRISRSSLTPRDGRNSRSSLTPRDGRNSRSPLTPRGGRKSRSSLTPRVGKKSRSPLTPKDGRKSLTLTRSSLAPSRKSSRSQRRQF